MIDLEEIAHELRTMKPHQPFYKLIKAEMQRRGRWKLLTRGWHVEKKNKDKEKES